MPRRDRSAHPSLARSRQKRAGTGRDRAYSMRPSSPDGRDLVPASGWGRARPAVTDQADGASTPFARSRPRRRGRRGVDGRGGGGDGFQGAEEWGSVRWAMSVFGESWWNRKERRGGWGRDGIWEWECVGDRWNELGRHDTHCALDDTFRIAAAEEWAHLLVFPLLGSQLRRVLQHLRFSARGCAYIEEEREYTRIRGYGWMWIWVYDWRRRKIPKHVDAAPEGG
ncbi:hypothetical protein DFH09DRAFT_1087029 [Mycena vulgaris]|nr:hypothetical protein DFH09DRAFT_1087029 [Mycena vulgaris]